MNKKNIDDKEKSILVTFKKRIEEQFPGEIKKILIYGSKARGEARYDSDIDVLVITKGDDWRMRDMIRSVAYDLDAEIGYALSVQVLSMDRIRFLRDNNFVFIKKLDQESIAL
jgi:uncharacterized protein